MSDLSQSPLGSSSSTGANTAANSSATQNPPLQDNEIAVASEQQAAASTTAASTTKTPADAKAGTLGSMWLNLVVGAIVVIGLLVFILQNLDAYTVQFFAWKYSLPLGVLVLFAVIAGALLMALFAAIRILQLRRRAKKV